MTKMAKEIVKGLLDTEAVFLNPNEPFTWAGGIKSPIYCDSRITMGYPAVREEITGGLAARIKKTLPEVEAVARTTTAGISHAVWVTDILGLPMVYIRSKAKDHGKGNQIEDRIPEGQKMVVIGDLIPTGGSVLEVVETAEREGATVLGVAVISTYELPRGAANFTDKRMALLTLISYSALIDVALEANYIEEKDVTLLQKRKKDPENRGK